MGECLGTDKRSTLNGGRGNPQGPATVPSSGNEGHDAYSTVVRGNADLSSNLRDYTSCHLRARALCRENYESLNASCA